MAGDVWVDSELVDTLMWNHDEIMGPGKGTPDWRFRPGKSTRKWVHSRLMTRRVWQGGSVTWLKMTPKGDCRWEKFKLASNIWLVSDSLAEINERGRPSYSGSSSVDALRRNCGCKSAERQEGSWRSQEIVRQELQRMTWRLWGKDTTNLVGEKMIELDEGRRESRDSRNGDLIHSLKPHTSDVMLGSKWRGSSCTLNCDWGDWLIIVNPIYFREGDVYLWQWDQAQIRGEKYFNLWRRMEEENWWWDRLKAGEVWFEIGNDESNDLHNWPSGLVWDQGREVSGEPWFVIWDDIDNYQPSWLQEKKLVMYPYTAERRDVLENTLPEAQEISQGRGFCTPRPERLPEGEARGQSRGPRGAKSPPEGNLEGRGGCIFQCIPTRGSVRTFFQN